jgi:hypothetical protein
VVVEVVTLLQLDILAVPVAAAPVTDQELERQVLLIRAVAVALEELPQVALVDRA